MARKRPGAVTAAAVLCIIYGSLLLVCGIIGLAGLALQGAVAGNGGAAPFDQKQAEEFLRREVPFYTAFNVIQAIWQFVEGVSLLAAGIGLLSLKPWARGLAIFILILAILRNMGSAVYQLLLLLPAMNRLFQQELPRMGPGGQEAAKVMQVGMTIGAVLLGLFALALLIYLFITLGLLLKASVRAAFAGAGDATPSDQDRPWTERPSRSDGYEDDEGWSQRPQPPPEGPPDDRFRS